MTTIYYTALTHSVSLTELEHLPRALLCVNEAGIIEWIEKDVPVDQLDAVLNAHGAGSERLVRIEEGGLVPGLVDTHTHAPQYPNIGTGSTLQLLDWLEQLTFPLESQFSDVDFARTVYPEVVKRNLKLGTTTCCYYATIHEESTRLLADACLEQGQRAFVGKCCMDRHSPDHYVESTESSIASTKSFVSYFDTLACSSSPKGDGMPPLVQPILTPRFALSCTDHLLDSLGESANSRTPSIAIQTHLSENTKEIESTLHEFPGCSTYTEVYDKSGLLGDGTILAHCVHLGQQEMELIRKRNAGVSHCPVSNMNLNSGVAEVRKLLDMRIKVGLGTDCSGGYAMGILPTLRLASTLSRFRAWQDPSSSTTPLSLPELFYLATLGGASLCRLDDRIGNFTVGKEFDALHIRGASINMWNSPGEAWEKTFERWVWCGDDRDIEAVWVRGRQVAGQSTKNGCNGSANGNGNGI